MPMVYEFDERMTFVNNYTLMDLDAHRIMKEDRSLSYNKISIDLYSKMDPQQRLQGIPAQDAELNLTYDKMKLMSKLRQSQS